MIEPARSDEGDPEPREGDDDRWTTASPPTGEAAAELAGADGARTPGQGS